MSCVEAFEASFRSGSCVREQQQQKQQPALFGIVYEQLWRAERTSGLSWAVVFWLFRGDATARQHVHAFSLALAYVDVSVGKVDTEWATAQRCWLMKNACQPLLNFALCRSLSLSLPLLLAAAFAFVLVLALGESESVLHVICG